MTSKVPVLVVGQAVHPTGYARVINSILAALKDRYEFHHFGINYKGPPLDCGWNVYPNQRPGDIFGIEQLPLLMEKIQPRLLFFMHDMYLYLVHRPWLDEHRGECKIVSYFPIDGADVAPAMLDALTGLDRAVLFTEFAKSEIEAALAKRLLEDESFRCPPLSVIPHGVDTNIFRPCEDYPTGHDFHLSRIKARAALFPDQPELSHAFIVLNANRNQPRKRIDITIEAFALFAKGKPENVKLYLHMGMEDRGYRLSDLIRRHDLQDRVLLTTASPQMPNIPDQRLNLLYNACDVGLNTSTGEGWGLVAFEHAATGAAQVLPRHSACAELWRDVARLVEPIESFRPPMDFMQYQTVSPVGVADVLEDLYRKPARLRELSVLAYKRATAPELQWSNIACKWDQLFQEEVATCRATSG